MEMEQRVRIQRTAKLYSANGWLCLPSSPTAKRPLVKLKEASRDPDKVNALFDRDCNLQVVTGEPSGVFVIDIDPRHGGIESYSKLASLINLPTTPSVTTGGGGTHFYYRAPAGIKIKSRELPGYPGIDIKGDGGMVIAPPSKHVETGEFYLWNKDARPSFTPSGIPFAEAPPELLDLIKDTTPAVDVTAVEQIVGGVRNVTLFRLAGSLRQKGMSEDRIKAHLILENSYCKPPLPKPELDSIVKSICRYEPGTVPADIKPDDLKSDPAHLDRITDAELRVKELEPIREIVPGILWEGVTLLVAKAKIGKSWLALQMAQAIAHGGYALGCTKVELGQVLYMALEDGQNRMQKRLRMLDEGRETLSTKNLHFVFEINQAARQSPQFMANDVLGPIVDELPDLRLIVVDTLARIRPRPGRGGFKGGYEDDYNFISPFQDLAKKRHIAVLVVHHLRKAGGEDILDEINATNGLSGSADAALALKRVRGDNTATLQVVTRDGEDASLALGFDQQCRWTVLGGADEREGNDLRRRVLEFIEDQPGQFPLGIAKALGIEYDSLRKLISRMAADDQIIRREHRYYPLASTPMFRYTKHRESCFSASTGVPCPECQQLYEEAHRVRQYPEMDSRN